MLKRLLPCAALIAVGTLNSGILGIATPVIAGILANILSNDVGTVWDRVAKHLKGRDDILRNQDLTKAVGNAIAAIIAKVSREDRFFDYQEALKKLARRAADDWTEISQSPEFLDDEGFEPLKEPFLVQMFSRTPSEFEQVKALTPQDWEKLLNAWQRQEPEAIRAPEVMHHLARQLHEQFPKALREVLKEDFAQGGKAFPGFIIHLLGEIRGAIGEQQTAILERLDRIGNGSPDNRLLEELQRHNLNVQSAISQVNVDFQKIEREIAVLQQHNTQAFQDLAKQIESDFDNVTELLREIEVIAEKTLAKIERVVQSQEEIIKDQREIKQLIKPFQKENLENAHPSTEHWQGRKAKLAEIEQLLENAQIRLIGILGLGGLGKSTLAAKIYQEFPQDKRFWTDLSQPQANFTFLAQRVLRHLSGYSQKQVEGIPKPNLVNALVALLQQERYLLVLDNLESLLHADGRWRQNNEFYEQFFAQWLQLGEKSQLLVTTREQPELPAIKTRWVVLDRGLEAAEGAELLKSLGILGQQSELESFTLFVGGYPLSLMLAAGLLLEEEADEPQIRYLSRYGNIYKIEGLHGGQQRVSVEDVLNWSWQRLSEEQQSLLQAVSVYRLPFDAATAKFVMPLYWDKSTSQEEVEKKIIATIERMLRHLTKRALLQEERDEEGERWYRLHPLVLYYVQHQAGNLTEVHQRAISFYKAIVSEKIESTNDVQAYQEIIYHQCQLGEYTEVDNFLSNNNEWLRSRGYYVAQVEMNQQLVQNWQPANEEEKVNYSWALTRLGEAYNSLGQNQQAIKHYQQSLAIFQEINERDGEANSYLGLGKVYNSLGQYQRAIDYYQQSLAIHTEIGKRSGEANSYMGLGYAYESLGQYQRAIDYYQQSLAIHIEIGKRSGEANSYMGLGKVYNSLGQYQRAIDYYQQSLAIFQEIGDRNREADSYIGLGNAYGSLGQYQRAIDHHQQSLAIHTEIGKRSGEADSYNNLGNAYFFLGQYKSAINYYQQSLAIYTKIGDRNGEANSYNNLGIAYESLGQYESAISYYQQSLAIKQEIGKRSEEADSYNNLGNAYNSLGQYQRAIDYYQQCLAICTEIGKHSGEASSYMGLGKVDESLGEYQRAINYYQQSLTIFQEIGERHGEANSYSCLGNAYFFLGQYQRAIDYHQQSLAIYTEIGGRNGEANSYNNLGIAYESLGQYQKAIDYYQQCLAICTEIGDRRGEAYSYNNLGSAYNSLRQCERAIGYHQQSLAIFQEIGGRNGEAYSYNNLGSAYNSLGQYQRAIGYHQQSLAICIEIGDRNEEANSYLGLGKVYNSLGQYQRSIDYYQQSLAICTEIGDRSGEANSWFNLGLTSENLNREADAIGAYRNASELYQAMELDAKVQDCDNAIERLSQPISPLSHSGWLSRLWQWGQRVWRWVWSLVRQ